ARRTEKASEVLIPRSLPNALCDRVRIREVFVNLLSNAFKYNDKPSAHIEIGYLAPHELARRAHWPQDTGTGPVYFVRDNGIGIRPRHFGQLFKMFKRLHGRDAFGGGTGAGLAIVKKLVERHGGQVWLDSEPDQGSTFYFSLPAGTATSHAPDT
ncbi:MAG: cyanobacterial phytochrome A, partial [Oxalobacteraceae bacterium]